ncbi:hypothetical protein B0T24DRAFT_679985 [Lasiosphaeria ovina]|uniref:RING-type domain-containing protein n=1 Tax=Lasiosphaeria ovina TaxID=92902 RepID=A0AAE0K6A6_9PEZI|nr:hypothetical protein B0T24DRAFT_679985 [Lasiosphaeria ovina]
MSRQQQQQQDTVSPAPCVSCAQCRSRVIWPVEYRGPSSTHKPGFIYVGCRSEHATAVHDPAALLAMLHGRVDPGAVRAATCSVCLETGFVASALRPACGDCQCVQRVCAPCLAAWRDGRNGVAALRCPFCRWRWDGDGVAG